MCDKNNRPSEYQADNLSATDVIIKIFWNSLIAYTLETNSTCTLLNMGW